MFKSVARITTGPSLGRALPKVRPSRRFVSTAPPHHQSRTWKSSATRWGLAGALVYYYNTASVFAEEPAYAVHAPPETQHERETYPTVEAVAEQRRSQPKASLAPDSHPSAVAAAPDAESTAQGSPEALEEEASQQGAFNEETGEINWDCPCLGGMAYGPCGEQFRSAFSCFVFSNADPKGVDCIENFKGMQNCFREHPDVYGAELEDDEAPPEEGEEPASMEARKPADEGAAKSAESPTGRGSQSETSRQQAVGSTPSPQVHQDQAATPPSSQDDVQQHVDASKAEDNLVPKSWHDGR
ncbi:Oxidoreductase [Saxophila tyrrhenica]|uniref:Mitochondrial intermembrane space import and assembly protein 40 n=1 Tax=Saxophila tyrrhenica TaxID=1690608 RepID=A0AAV9PT57_9PEZI|nr:Oxidoreductase [Saxophila tyrrhenica]